MALPLWHLSDVFTFKVQLANSFKSVCYSFNKEHTSVPGMCNCGYIPLSHLGNIVMRMGTTTTALIEIDRFVKSKSIESAEKW